MRVIIRRRRSPGRFSYLNRDTRTAGPLTRWLRLASVLAAGVCIWRVGADLGLVAVFPFEQTLLARWHVWFGISGALWLVALGLSRGTETREEEFSSGDSSPDAGRRAA